MGHFIKSMGRGHSSFFFEKMRNVPISVICLLILVICAPVVAKENAQPLISMAMRDADLSEVMEMLSRQNRINILLGENTEAEVSFNLYDVRLDQAIDSIANAAGYTVEKRRGTYFILPPADAGKIPGSGFKIVRTFPIQYADAAVLETKLEDYVSEFGTITAVPERKLLVVEDQPGFVRQIAALVAALDQRPQQIMIEARILEVTLNDEQSYGIDWTSFFDEKDGSFGLQGLDTPGAAGGTGFFFDYVQSDYEIAIRALEAEGRIRNLASPKLVTVENEEAEVIIGQRLGYQVTTTINQVTSETIEFLESGVILRVVPAVDDDDRILLTIHPEVSNGVLDDNGIPSQTTTEVTTQLLVKSGQSIFIGGLLRHTTTEGRAGVPVLGRIPGIRWLFGNRTRQRSNTETVVLITPRLLDEEFAAFSDEKVREIDRVEDEMGVESSVIEEHIEDFFGVPETQSPVTETNSESLQLTTEANRVEGAAPPIAEAPEARTSFRETNAEKQTLAAEEREVEISTQAAIEPAENRLPVAQSTANNRPLATEQSEAGNSPPTGTQAPAIPLSVAETNSDDLQLDTESSDGEKAPPTSIEAPDAPSPVTEINSDDLQLSAESSDGENTPTSSIEPIDLGALPEYRTSGPSAAEPSEPLQSAMAEDAAGAADASRDTQQQFVENTGPGAINETISRPTAARGLYAINLESALDPIELNSIAPSLAAPDQQIYMTEVEVDGSTWYRLRLGFFETQTEGDRIMAELKDQYPYAWVVRVAPREHAIAEENAVFPAAELTAEVAN